MTKKYWELLHTVPYSDDYYEFIRLVGIFSTEIKAFKAKELLKVKPGFIDYPDNFFIREAHVNEDSWQEGFIDD